MSMEILKTVFIAALATNCHCNCWILWGSSRAPFDNCRHVPFMKWENDMLMNCRSFLGNIKANGSDISKSKRYCDHVPLDNKLQVLFAAHNLLAQIVPHSTHCQSCHHTTHLDVCSRTDPFTYNLFKHLGITMASASLLRLIFSSW